MPTCVHLEASITVRAPRERGRRWTKRARVARASPRVPLQGTRGATEGRLAGRLTAWRGGRTPRRQNDGAITSSSSGTAVSATLIPSPSQPDRTQGASSGPDDGRAAELGGNRDLKGRECALIARPGAGGSALVIDQDAGTLADRRLVAHLAADEPAANARIAADLYLGEPDGRFAPARGPRLALAARRSRPARGARAAVPWGTARRTRAPLPPGRRDGPPLRPPDALAAPRFARALGDGDAAHGHRGARDLRARPRHDPRRARPG